MDDATAEERSRLRLPAGSDVVCVERVRLADGEPVAVEEAVFPGTLRSLLDVDLAAGSLHEAVIALGRVPSSGTATLTAQEATDDDAHLLGVPAGSALLVEKRLIVDEAGDPVELTQSRYAGRRYGLTVSFGVEQPR